MMQSNIWPMFQYRQGAKIGYCFSCCMWYPPLCQQINRRIEKASVIDDDDDDINDVEVDVGKRRQEMGWKCSRFGYRQREINLCFFWKRSRERKKGELGIFGRDLFVVNVVKWFSEVEENNLYKVCTIM